MKTSQKMVIAYFNRQVTRVISQNGNFYVEAWDEETGDYLEVIDNKRYLPSDKDAALKCAEEIASNYDE